MSVESTKQKSKPFWVLFSAILVLVLIQSYQWFISWQVSPDNITASVQKTFLRKEIDLNNEVEKQIQAFDTIHIKQSLEKLNKNFSGLKQVDFLLFIFSSDSIIFWNDSKMPISELYDRGSTKIPSVVELANGWYFIMKKQVGSYVFLSAILLKNEYSIENNYLRNEFDPDFENCSHVDIDLHLGKHSIFSSSGTFMFNLIFNQSSSTEINLTQTWVLFLLVVLLSILTSVFLYSFYCCVKWFQARENFLVLMFIMDLIILRIVQQGMKFPQFLYQSELFSPAWYSSSFILPSLGDFLLDAILLLICSIVYNRIDNKRKHSWERFGKYRMLRMLLSLLLCFFLTFMLHYLISDLLLNSSFSVQLQDVSNMEPLSGIGLLIILLLICSYWFVSSRILATALCVNFVSSMEDAPRKESHIKDFAIFNNSFRKVLISDNFQPVIIFIAAAIVVSALGFVLTGGIPLNERLIFSCTFLVYVVIFSIIKLLGKHILSFSIIIIFLTFFSIIGTWMMNNANDSKSRATDELFVTKMSNRRNPVTEIMFEKVQTKIHSDTSFWLNVFDHHKIGSNTRVIQDLLKERYFNGYWDKYNIQITVCDSLNKLTIQPEGYLAACNEFFKDVIRDYGRSTALPTLFFLDYGYGKENYLGVLSHRYPELQKNRKLWLFIEISLNSVSADPGFPGLLIDKSNINGSLQGAFSYAVYKENKLLHSVGKYPYPTEIFEISRARYSIPQINEFNYKHEFYTVDTNTLLLISKMRPSVWNWITPFPYLFLFFSIFICCFAIASKISNRQHLFQSSLQNRMYFVLIGILILTMVITGFVQVFNILSFNFKKDYESLRERVSSIGIEIQHKFGNDNQIYERKDRSIDDFLIKLSNVFFTEINLYGPDGILLSTSRPQLFNTGILSGRMNPEAVQQLVLNKRMTYIHREQIGEMDFLSAYMPLYNNHNDLLGFINLPYFSKGDESKREIASFLVTFLNIYIVILLLGVFITILISNHITAPLDVLAVKLSRIRIGKSNEKIQWSKKDEIGQLVAEYNRMVDELEESAKLLTQSERERAWREMARQVAHEIKNPLTPMKLSAQYFEKAWKENAPDLDLKLSRFIKTLITQIDMLSEISSDFSDFAKLPHMKLEQVKVEEIVNFVVSLYRDSSPVQFDIVAFENDLTIMADRSQLTRVFTNLINNSIQAIEDKQNGKIVIKLWKETGLVVVSVVDNGGGITPEQEKEIFKPGFTTKQRGMGLGLVIVKTIIESLNGEISYIKPDSEGAGFLIRIPAEKNQFHTNETNWDQDH